MGAAWQPNWAMPAGSRERWPDDYERGRPGWPSAVLDVVAIPAEATVLDLAAGTGKLTRLLSGKFREVVAVEPAAEMRRRLTEDCPGVEALVGSAEAIPIADVSVDAVFVAQAFHHFDEPRAVREIVRVLRPGGALALLFNLPAEPWQPSTEAAEAVLRERMPDVDYVPLDLGGPSAESGWQLTAVGSLLEPFRTAVLPNPQTLGRDGLVAFYATMGWVADLPDGERMSLLEAVRSRLEPVEYRRAWETHVHWACRSD